MKTIRKIFETNSSSSNAFTLGSFHTGEPDVTIVGKPIEIKEYYMPVESDPRSKAQFILCAFQMFGREEEVIFTKETIEEFTGLDIIFEITKKVYGGEDKKLAHSFEEFLKLEKYDLEDEDEDFYELTELHFGEDSNSAEDIKQLLAKLSMNKDNVLSFVFNSKNDFDVESVYDG